MRIKFFSSLYVIFISAMPIIFPQTVLALDQKATAQAPLFYDLGSVHWPVSTTVPLAQRFFDQGLVLYYGFEWGESIRSFKEATRLDPKCGMCYWGLALALGSKVNAPVSGREYADAKAAIQKALLLQDQVTQKERAYIQALAIRFKHQPKKLNLEKEVFNCHKANAMSEMSSKKEIMNYVRAMKKITEAYSSDNNAKALYAYALFDAADWFFWDIDGKKNPLTPTLKKTLEAIMANDKIHVGANHYYVHLMEQSPQPETALESAARLKTLVPGSEHLVHMPTHIYFLTGRYHEGSEANLQAIAAIKKYKKVCHAQGFEPEINYLYLHDYDFLRTTAVMEGRQKLAMAAAREMVEFPFLVWLEDAPNLQWFMPIPYFVEVRFGLWQDVLKEPKPKEKYQYALGMWHYARGMAFAHTGQTKSAEDELAALNAIIHKGPADNNFQKKGIDLLTVANIVLRAKLADLQGNEKRALAFLRTAAKMQESQGYHEPPDWYFPITEALANAYLKWNHPQQAIVVYQQNLKQYPKNGWALYGLAKALRQVGKTQEAEQIENEFKKVWQYADIPTPINM
jgi:tetratricopeptide (TPR) repeat protein